MFNLGFDRKAMTEALDDDALAIAVRMEERRAAEANITSVPSVIVNGRYLIPGAQEPEVYRETLRRVVEMEQRA